MERWRWLPHDLGERHIEVNLPEYHAARRRERAVVHRARVIVGKPDDADAGLLEHDADRVIVNPYWHMPPSIMKNEILPKLAEDPNYAARLGYEVIRRGNSI